MFARAVVYLHAACPELSRRAHLPVPKNLAAKSRVSITSKLIEINGLQLHYFGHLRKTGGRGSYRLVHTPLSAVDCGLLAVRGSQAAFSISFISPTYEHQSRISFVSPTYAKTGVGGMSSQSPFLQSFPFRPFLRKCRRADILDFSPDFSHFSCPERGAKRLSPPARLGRRPLHKNGARPGMAAPPVTGHQSPFTVFRPLPVTSLQYCEAIARDAARTEPIRIPPSRGNPPNRAGMSPLTRRCPDADD